MEHAVSFEMLLGRLVERLSELSAFTDRVHVPLALEFSADGERWRTIEVGAPWPERATPVRFRYRGSVPASMAGGPLHLAFDVGGEALLKIDGRSFAGLNPYHREVRLFERADANASFLVEIEAVPHGLFGYPIERPVLREAALIAPDEDVRGLVFDLEATIYGAKALHRFARSDAALLLLDAAAETFAMVPLPRERTDPYLARLAHGARRMPVGNPGDTPGSMLERGLWERWRFDGALADLGEEARTRVRAARGHLQEKLRAIREVHPSEGSLLLSGHAHIDLAWLWPYAETRRKARRTFSTVLHLMERDPKFCFNQSSAQLYAWIEEDDPELFERIRARVAEGRWEIVGGMWVEADGNMPGGEAWARQLLYGQRWFLSRFGKTSTVSWFPDTFGYTANLPQLLLQGGLRYFFTTKLGWNETTRFPFELYRWEGIDGSRILAMMVKTEAGYNGVVDPEKTLEAWKSYRGKRQSSRSIFTFGHGDGGGGPTSEMLEQARRQTDFPGLPELVHGRIDEHFERLEPLALPAWVGEQYLEYHRGTYTSQAALKRLDRKLTCTLAEAEIAASFSFALLSRAYPADAFQRGWTTLMRNQFHDVLPGSGTHTVANEAVAELTHALAEAEHLRSEHLEALAASVGVKGLVVFNLSLEDRPLRGWMPRPMPGDFRLLLPDGGEASWQADGDRILVSADVQVPGLGYLALRAVAGAPAAKGGLIVRNDLLENDRFRIQIGTDGTLTSIFDKRASREVLSDRANQIWAYPDVPRNYDAWDIDPDYAAEGREIVAAAPPAVVVSGPVYGAVEMIRRVGAASIRQRYVLRAGAERLEIETEIQWTGRRTLVRALFPLAVRSHEAWFETAFGAVARPTHRNLPHDAARFEVSAHRWADLSEPGYGVSLLNDSKYGHSADGSTLGLTLLRSPIYPDPYADEGVHRFTYAVHPHAGDRRTSTIREAHDLNSPLIGVAVEPKGSWPASRRFLSLSESSLRLSALKKHEDSGALVLRVYESEGGRGAVEISGELEIARWNRTDLLEEKSEPMQGRVAYGPFAVITLTGSPKADGPLYSPAR
jgi:alpha-mannosidase